MIRPKFQSKVPMCCDSQWQADGWIDQARKVDANPKCGFCTDCTPFFKAKMMMLGRCENPGVKFHESVVDGVYGALS